MEEPQPGPISLPLCSLFMGAVLELLCFSPSLSGS